MERAVLLSDIEFLPEVHESDWERIEAYDDFDLEVEQEDDNDTEV